MNKKLPCFGFFFITKIGHSFSKAVVKSTGVSLTVDKTAFNKRKIIVLLQIS